jgi:lipopolysaccharide biosynthesis glycosyltransferase
MTTEIHLACTIDNNYVTHCGIMLKSLFFNNRESIFNIYIFHNGIIEKKINKLKNYVIDEGHKFNNIQIDDSSINNAPVTHHVSLATYYRILIPELLNKNLEKILFLDSDLIIRKNIIDLWNTDLNDSCVGACLEYVDKAYKLRLGLEKGADYFNAGVLLINLRIWREKNITPHILDYIKNNAEKLLSWDQDALNIIFQNQWKKLNIQWNIGQNFYKDNCLSEYYGVTPQRFIELKSDPSIIHFTGSDKPWNYFNTHPLKSEYLFYKSISPWKYEKLIDAPHKKNVFLLYIEASKKAIKKLFYIN